MQSIYITCNEDYRGRFEELFATRTHAIDRMPVFFDMKVLRPKEYNEHYPIVSFWGNEEAFQGWTKSPEFIEGHKRGFADIAAAKHRDEEPPMSSDYKGYEVFSR